MLKASLERKGKSPQDILLELGVILGSAHFKVDILERKRRPAEAERATVKEGLVCKQLASHLQPQHMQSISSKTFFFELKI